MQGDPNPRTASGRWKSMDGHRSATRIVQRKAGLVAVYEREPVPEEAVERALVFESADFTIELSEYPADWHRMTDDQLSALIKT
jgi:hypothetical protein